MLWFIDKTAKIGYTRFTEFSATVQQYYPVITYDIFNDSGKFYTGAVLPLSNGASPTNNVSGELYDVEISYDDYPTTVFLEPTVNAGTEYHNKMLLISKFTLEELDRQIGSLEELVQN